MQNYKQISDKYAFSLDNRQIAFLGTGILGMLLLFFLLGVLYGTRLGSTRGFAAASSAPTVAPPVESAPAEAATASRAETRSSPAADTPKEHVFELGEEDLSESSPTAKPVEQAAARRVAAAQQDPREQAEPEMPEAAKAAATPEPKAAPVNTLEQMSGNYTVQVGSFTRAGDAQRMAANLESDGYPAYVARGVVDGTTYYRVRVGKYQTRDEASRIASKVKRSKAIDAFTTRIN